MRIHGTRTAHCGPIWPSHGRRPAAPVAFLAFPLTRKRATLAIPPSPQAATGEVVEAMADKRHYLRTVLVHQIERSREPPSTHLTSLYRKYRNRLKHDARPIPCPPTTGSRSVSVVWY